MNKYLRTGIILASLALETAIGIKLHVNYVQEKKAQEVLNSYLHDSEGTLFAKAAEKVPFGARFEIADFDRDGKLELLIDGTEVSNREVLRLFK